MSELTEGAVTARVPFLVDERLQVVGRREPVTVAPHTSLAECLAAIRRSGTGDSVFVVNPDGRLAGVLTERDIFGRLVGGDVPPIDLDQPVETLMTTKPHHLHLEETVRDAIELLGRRGGLALAGGGHVVVSPPRLASWSGAVAAAG